MSETIIRRVTWIGLLINIFLSALKMAAGIYGESRAMVADAVHSLTDTITDIAVIAGSYFWSLPPDPEHPYGHSRIETLISIFIGIALFAAGVGLALDAVNNFSCKTLIPPRQITVYAALVSLFAKEILFQFTRRWGEKLKSKALLANAWHHRLDAISSIPVLLAVSGAILFPDFAYLDRIGAVIASVFIVQAAFHIIRKGIREFMDTAAPPAVLEVIKSISMAHAKVIQVHDIRTRYIGSFLQIDMHIVVDGKISVQEGHEIAHHVKNRIMQEASDILDVLIHIEPSGISLRKD